MITTCWSEDQNQRLEVVGMHEVFSASSLQEVQKVKTGNWVPQTAGNFAMAKSSQTSKQKENDTAVKDSVRESPLSCSLYWFQIQRPRGLLMK